ncbi:putative ribonuclease H protein, partial [Trifolium medium]|nr:putative ribonuclease H protein [Trifolium medium]
MIKSVLQAIPAYVMSMFILPSSFIDDIEKMINAFWWGGGNGNSKGIHWLAWERLACPKDKGGLGFRNFEAFNMAMVAKQAWKILQNPDTLVARLIKARYFPRSTLLEASLGYNPSFAWRSIWKARQVLLLGCRWRIGGGDKIHVMSDPWLRGNGERWIPSPQPEGMYNLFVRDLMVDNYKAWNVTKIRMLFPVQVAERIIATPLIGSVYVDKMVWEEERNGCYSVKSGYKLAMQCIFRNDKYHVKGNWKEIWKAHAPHKARHLLWRLCRGCIPTRCRLLERHVDCDVHCPLCEDEVEDDVHVFFTCASAQFSWQAAGLSSVLGSAACQQGSAADRVFALCRNEDYATIGRVAMLLWSIWHNRNDKIWNDNARSPNQIGRAAFGQWNEWIAVHKLRSNDDHDVPLVSTIRWEKPRIGWLKCNVDADFLSVQVGPRWVLVFVIIL